MNDLSEVKARIRCIVMETAEIRQKLLGVQASLPASSLECSPEDVDADLDAPTEFQLVIANCISDYLDPLSRALRDLLTYEPVTPTPSGEAGKE